MQHRPGSGTSVSGTFECDLEQEQHALKFDIMRQMGWTKSNWLDLLQTAVLAGALIVIAVGLFLEARARRVANLIRLTQAHRELWERMYEDPDLSRILDFDADLTETPPKPEEEMFVVFLILHLSSTYFAIRSGFFQKPHGLRKDIERFFSLPIPRDVWGKVKVLQEPAFMKFVERNFPSETSSSNRE